MSVLFFYKKYIYLCRSVTYKWNTVRIMCKLRSFLTTFVILSLFAVPVLKGQNTLYKEYISRYKNLAIEQMNRYGIPASITLAQGLLESGAGRSTLAVKGNNHFGIKAGSDWAGRYMLRHDDLPNEKFRVYRSVRESYEDHSQFLRNRQRYSSLFSLKRTDYKGWARGLKSAGYATNPRYAQSLIDIIECYDLAQYDSKGQSSYRKDHGHRGPDYNNSKTVYRCNGSRYIVARAGETFASLAKLYGVKERKLRKYNEVEKRFVLRVGEIVYLDKKASKAARSLKGRVHNVKAGESLHSIAQSYGMRLNTLYKINGLTGDYELKVGDRLLIRK